MNSRIVGVALIILAPLCLLCLWNVSVKANTTTYRTALIFGSLQLIAAGYATRAGRPTWFRHHAGGVHSAATDDGSRDRLQLTTDLAPQQRATFTAEEQRAIQQETRRAISVRFLTIASLLSGISMIFWPLFVASAGNEVVAVPLLRSGYVTLALGMFYAVANRQYLLHSLSRLMPMGDLSLKDNIFTPGDLSPWLRLGNDRPARRLFETSRACIYCGAPSDERFSTTWDGTPIPGSESIGFEKAKALSISVSYSICDACFPSYVYGGVYICIIGCAHFVAYFIVIGILTARGVLDARGNTFEMICMFLPIAIGFSFMLAYSLASKYGTLVSIRGNSACTEFMVRAPGHIAVAPVALAPPGNGVDTRGASGEK